LLDGILDSETELTILEHTTDKAGYTEIVFAVFDLLGLSFAPRIRDIGSQQLYLITQQMTDLTLKPLLRGVLIANIY
jgi:TnpA family transposase